ncbi:MAG: MraY family glycosyltransferase [Tahibacter sp.]
MALTDWICTIATALVTAVVAWCLIPWAQRHHLVDEPNGRHDHMVSTAVVGGIAIFLGIAGVSLARGGGSKPFLGLLIAACLIVAVGILDDLRDLSWRIRLLAHAAAALIIAASGVYATSVGHLVDFGFWALPFSVFATVGIINAVNMIDGSDGLSGCLVTVALGFFALCAADAGDLTFVAELMILVGGIVGFLALNLRLPGQPTARIFLGNSGSALLGLIVAWSAFRLAQIPGNAAGGILAPWMIAIPLIDCVVLMMRRLLNGRSPFWADRNHIHHLMRDAGYSAQRIVGVATLAALVAGAAAFIGLRVTGSELSLVLVFLGLIAIHFAWTHRRERAVAHLRRRARLASAQNTNIYIDRAGVGHASLRRKSHD